MVHLQRTLKKNLKNLDQEQFDLTFVNAMFEHIITSLVFDKYGNIYGFLAKMFLTVEKLEINEVLNVIITSLENERFDNEYGESSILSLYAADRIFNDIISPLFPRAKNDISLLSLDYIYAQAGLMFLRTGQENNVYFYYKSYAKNLNDENLFEEYLVTGQVIEKLIQTDESNQQMLKAFALPALTHYILRSKFVFSFENIGKLISRHIFWQMAYKDLFQYTIKMFDDIENKFRNDFKYNMHIAISTFQSCSTLAEKTLEEYCPNTKVTGRNSNLTFYINYPTSFACKVNELLPDPRENFRGQIYNITELFETYFFKLVKNSLSNYLSSKFDYETVIIKILIPNNHLGNYFDTKYLFYDLLEVYTPRNISFQYYVLNYEKSDITIKEEFDVTENCTEEIDFYFQKLKSLSKPVVLKTTDQNTTVFLQNLVKYKKSRLEDQLEILEDCQGENREMKNNWWKEFGLWLSPYEECFLAKKDNYTQKFCGINSFKLLNTYRTNQISSIIVEKNTHALLTSIGTNIKSVLLRNESSKAVDEIVPKKYVPSVMNALNETIFEDITLNIKKPEFHLSANVETIRVLERIINSLKEKTHFNFTSVLSSLSKILILKSNYFRRIGTIGKNNSRLAFVNTLNNRTDTGYGYKFIFLSGNKMELAHLRTDYEFKEERFYLLIPNSEKGEKRYLAINNVTFESEPYYSMYEINNQLRKRSSKIVFSGISIQEDDLDENCSKDEYFEKKKEDNCCRRRYRFAQNSANREEAIQHIMEETRKPKEEIRMVLEKYPFFDSKTLSFFINEWLNSNFSKEPSWGQSYTIENSDLLRTLLYDLYFETHNITNFDGDFRIGSFYSKEERSEIEEDAKIESIIESYNNQKARFALTFHDYYAIRNYATKGFTRITRDTNEAKLMKLALYKLAIRQFDDPGEAFNVKLFRVETKPISFLKTTLANITLQKFTHAYSSAASAVRFGAYPFKGYINIIYEMTFSGQYARVKIEQFYSQKEENVILLPGSMFSVEGSSTVKIGGLGNVLKLKLKFQNTFNDKLLCIRNIMNEITLINF